MRYALKNVIRAPKKSLLLLFLIVFCLSFVLFSLFVRTLCLESEERSLGPLHNAYAVENDEGEPFLPYPALLDLKASCDSVSGVEAYIRLPARMDIDFSHKGEFEFITGERYVSSSAGAASTKVYDKLPYQKGFSVCGVTEMDILPEYYGGEIEMVSGTPITKANNEGEHLKIVISEAIAKKNGLSLGDSVTLDVFSLFTDETSEIGLDGFREANASHLERADMVFTVGGIYRSFVDNASLVSVPSDIKENRVYVPLSVLDTFRTIENVDFMDYTVLVPDVSYLFLPEADAAKLERELNSFGFFETVSLRRLSDAFASSPAALISRTVRSVLILVTATGLLLLALILFFWMNARKREFGVLVSLGKPRFSVAASFSFEYGLVMLAALLICFPLFTLLVKVTAEPITAYLLASENTVRSAELIGSTIAEANLVETNILDKTVDMAYLLPTYVYAVCEKALIGLAMVFAASLIGVYMKIRSMDPLREAGGKE